MAFEVTKKDLRSLVEEGVSNHGRNEKGLEKLGGAKGLCRKLKTDPSNGREDPDPSEEARLTEFGRNYVPPKPQKSLLYLMWQALQDFTLVMLVVSAVVSLVLGMTLEDPSTGWIEGTAILVSVCIVVMVSACNDYAKEKQFRKLNEQVKDISVSVIRGGHQKEVSVMTLCVGDIVELKVGDIIPADGVFLDGHDLKCDESAMTGETDFIKKSTETPFLLSGTKVMEGSCSMVVVAVGPNSQAGIIKTLVTGQGKEKEDGDDEEEEVQSVLQAKLELLAMQIGYAGTVVAAVCVLVMAGRFSLDLYMAGESLQWEHAPKLLGFFITGITILVVAVPEGLPLAVTLSLAFSVQKMQLDNNLVKHLDACETMGSATTICSDKTGTLTTNRMTVMRAWLGGRQHEGRMSKGQLKSPEFERVLLEGIAVNSSGRVERLPSGAMEHIGSKTDCALVQMADDLGYNYLGARKRVPVEKVYTFSSARKRMSTLVKRDDKFVLYTKGASEIILARCTHLLGADMSRTPMTDADRARYCKEIIEAYASDALRTICIAYREFDTAADWEDVDAVEAGLTCIGIVGIEDPVRPEVPEAIRKCAEAGITVRMVTGDNLITARSIAKKCGLLDAAGNYTCIEGPDFRARVLDSKGNLKQAEFDKIWPNLRVMARSSPTDKYTLVTGLLETKSVEDRPVVAVTGDGTNDAPALKKADVGFAMGIAGTSVAKDACDIILMDDNFNSIVKAVKWGRNVYDSIGKFLQFQLTVNVVAIVVAFVGACVLEESPLTAVQMLWVNLIMDSFASLALATESPTDDLLKRKPYGRSKALISPTMWLNILGHSVYQLAVVLTMIFYGHELMGVPDGRSQPHDAPPTEHYTMVFNVFVLMQLVNEINARKLHGELNVFAGIFSNVVFLAIWVGTLVAQVVIITFGGRPLSCVPLSMHQWQVCLGLALLELPWNFVVRSIPKAIKSLLPKVNPQVQAKEKVHKLWIRGGRRIQLQKQTILNVQSSVHLSREGLLAAAAKMKKQQ